MDEKTLDKEQIKKERAEILKEIGPTYYDLTGIPTDEKGILDYMREEIEDIEEKIEELKTLDNRELAEAYTQKYGYFRNALMGIFHTYNQKHDLDLLISEVSIFKKGILMEERRQVRRLIRAEKNGNNDLAQLTEYDAELMEIEGKIEMLSVLGNRKAREAYNAKLEKKIDEIQEARRRAEFVRKENEKKENLRRNRRLRKITSREIVEEELGEDFNPDRSNEKYSEVDYKYDTPDSPLTKWKVELYPEKRLFFEIQTANKRYPELNQNVSVYRYGTFEFETLFNNGKPTKEDKTCEIIGVKRVDIEGNVEEDFLIAQTMEIAHMDRLPMRKILELRKKGINVSIAETPEEAHRKAIKERRNQLREANRGKIEKSLMKIKRLVVPDPVSVQEKIDLDEEKDVLVFEKRLVSLTPEEQERLGRIYLSDYLVDNAIKNNARYIGSLKHPEFMLDTDGIRAASYAERRPGIVIDRLYSFGNDTQIRVKNIEDVLEIIKSREKNKPTNINAQTRKDTGKIIKFPTLED